MKTMNVYDLKKKIDQKDHYILLDVREEWEREICALPHSISMPMSVFDPNALTSYCTMTPTTPIILYCHHGVRSMHALYMLEEFGFTNLYNLEGGIHQWAQNIDVKMAIYG